MPVNTQSETIGKLADRFYDKVFPEPNSGCHLWTASVNRLGYGTITVNRKLRRAHRVAWELAHGPIPAGKMVLHRCDVRGCVNPSHLFLGTQTDNMRDMARKGRGRSIPQPGERNPMAKLDKFTVSNIRLAASWGTFSQAFLARAAGVSPMTVSRIVNNETWKGV